MTPHEWLLSAARRAMTLLEAQVNGTYWGPSEDISTMRDLAAAIKAVEEEQERLVSR